MVKNYQLKELIKLLTSYNLYHINYHTISLILTLNLLTESINHLLSPILPRLTTLTILIN